MELEAGWGEPAPLPDDAEVAASDAEVRHLLEECRRQRREPPTVALVGGDLCRTLGGGSGRPAAAAARLRSQGGPAFTIDVGEVLADGHLRLFVAHLVARTPRWRRAFVAMNAQYLTPATYIGPLRLPGRGWWDLGPRAHPSDGLLDTYSAELGLTQALAVRSRVRHGAHLPHPQISSRRTGSLQVEWDQPRRLFLDGEAVGHASVLSVRVRPRALVVHV